MQREANRFVELSTVVAFIDATVSHGAPTRVAITRASRRFHIERDLVVAVYRSAGETF